MGKSEEIKLLDLHEKIIMGKVLLTFIEKLTTPNNVSLDWVKDFCKKNSFHTARGKKYEFISVQELLKAIKNKKNVEVLSCQDLEKNQKKKQKKRK